MPARVFSAVGAWVWAGLAADGVVVLDRVCGRLAVLTGAFLPVERGDALAMLMADLRGAGMTPGLYVCAGVCAAFQ